MVENNLDKHPLTRPDTKPDTTSIENNTANMEHMRHAGMNPFSLDKILVANMPWLPSKTTTEWGVQVRLITATRR